ncbi:hypothetical protein MIJ3_00159 [Pseudomonas phage vB_PaeM_MIJ3]|nr:hypothetical protein GBBBJNDB_00159 [Pseudomonas phage Callisto]WPK39825.1 hypothetical protein ETTORE_0116 [Pseudomonas phage Ettore]VOH54520.1 hypothetical protein MIJ3_00159 [Pseudomonas phage vB_PaeM_MIJ3]
MKVIIIPIESIETRYTSEWNTFLKPQLEKYINESGLDAEIVQIDVDYVDEGTSAGAFLNFANTNIFKSNQFIKLASIIETLNDNDVVLYTDAWNPTVVQLNYMRSLMNKKFKIMGLWHAGSYDPHDFLGRHFDKNWSYEFERSLYNIYDVNFYATNFSKDLMIDNLFGKTANVNRHDIVGWPMEYLVDQLTPSPNKTDTILFPHRISPEKQPNIFKKLRSLLPNYEFVFAQETKLSKAEYHTLLKRSKIVFSASLQETLGIGFYEGALVGAIPLLPDRLSYKEMTENVKNRNLYVYPNEWTISENLADLKNLVTLIDYTMRNYNFIVEEMKLNLLPELNKYYNGTELYKRILK